MSQENEDLLRFFGVKASRLPALRLIRSGESERIKFQFNGEFTESAIREFVEKYFRDELAPFILSEDPYTERDGSIRVLVGSEFESVVFDPKVNVFVEFVVNVGFDLTFDR